MKFQELWAKIKPSKKVWIPTAIAVGIVAFTLFSKSEIAENIRDTVHIKSPIESINYDPTVVEITEKDTDGDGIVDWEETLWGTDPNSIDTNGDGITDFDEIQAKKVALNSDSDLNETDIFARELMISVLSLGNEGKLNEASYDAIVTDALNSTVSKPRTSFYSTENIPSRTISTETYIVNFNNFLNETDFEKDNTINLLDEYLNTGDTSNTDMIQKEAEKYKAAEAFLLEIPASIEYRDLHISLLNNLHDLAEDVSLISEIDENPISSLTGLSYYPDDKSLLADTLSLYNKMISEL